MLESTKQTINKSNSVPLEQAEMISVVEDYIKDKGRGDIKIAPIGHSDKYARIPKPFHRQFIVEDSERLAYAFEYAKAHFLKQLNK